MNAPFTQIAHMDGTNLFLATLNGTSAGDCPAEKMTVFCPCDTRGRACILCPTTALSEPDSHATPNEPDGDDQSFCECPCECPLNQCKKWVVNSEFDASFK